MSPSELRQKLADIGWSQRDLAAYLGRNERSVRRMARGLLPIDQTAAEWLDEAWRMRDVIASVRATIGKGAGPIDGQSDMTAQEFCQILDDLGWTFKDAAEMSGRYHADVRRMAHKAGFTPPPAIRSVDGAMATWLRRVHAERSLIRRVQDLLDSAPERAAQSASVAD